MPAEAPAVGGAATTTFPLETVDGVSLVATLTIPSSRPRATVVLCHGFTAHRRDAKVLDLTEDLVAAGFAVLGYDARGHGDAGGLCTLGDAERYDVATAVEAARTTTDAVIVVGASMGAVAALRYAATDDTLAGVVAVSSPARWRLHSPQSVLGALMTRTRPGRYVVRRSMGVRVAPKWTKPEAPDQLVRRIRVPLAVVHGRADRFIPASEGELLARRATGEHMLDVVPHMGHAFGPRADRPIVGAVEWALAAYNRA